MMTEKTPPEPSMDEILASIRQIISSDVKEQPQPFFPDSEIEDILDLTNAFPEDQDNTKSPNLSSEMKFQRMDECTSNTNQQPWSDKEQNPPLNPFQASDEHTLDHLSFDDSLLAQATVSEATRAFHLLNKNIKEKQFSPDPRLQEGPGGQALENLMRELLKPLLKEWLDVHLPSLVRQIVTQQVEKIVHQASVAPAHSPDLRRHPGI